MKPAEGATVIGKSVVVRGEVTGSEELYVDGKIDGTITLTESRLTIGPEAQVHAELHVHDLIVFGLHEGSITATGRVELRQNASVTGNVAAARLSIEESASFRGNVLLTGREG